MVKEDKSHSASAKSAPSEGDLQAAVEGATKLAKDLEERLAESDKARAAAEEKLAASETARLEADGKVADLEKKLAAAHEALSRVKDAPPVAGRSSGGVPALMPDAEVKAGDIVAFYSKGNPKPRPAKVAAIAQNKFADLDVEGEKVTRKSVIRSSEAPSLSSEWWQAAR